MEEAWENLFVILIPGYDRTAINPFPWELVDRLYPDWETLYSCPEMEPENGDAMSKEEADRLTMKNRQAWMEAGGQYAGHAKRKEAEGSIQLLPAFVPPSRPTRQHLEEVRRAKRAQRRK
jgi:hypothetical protein